MKEVWVTGIGFITSIGNDRSSVTESLLNLRHGIVNPGFSSSESPVKVAGTIKEFNVDPADPEDWVYPEIYRVPQHDTSKFFSPCAICMVCGANRQLVMPI